MKREREGMMDRGREEVEISVEAVSVIHGVINLGG